MFRYLCYLLFLVALGLLSCKKAGPAPIIIQKQVDPQTNMPYKFTYLALGDSYTIGQNVPENDRWGVQLADLLRTEGVSVGNPTTIARTGWTTGELISNIAAANPPQTFDLVSLLIGVNNQYRGQSLALYRQEFGQLLQTATKAAKNDPTKVIVLSIPDWGVTPFGGGSDRPRIAREIDAFNAVAKEETDKAGIVFIDITPLSRTYGNDPSYVANDGLHYSGKMHREWAKLALPTARTILK